MEPWRALVSDVPEDMCYSIKGPGPRAGSAVDKAALRTAQKSTNCIVHDANYACFATC